MTWKKFEPSLIQLAVTINTKTSYFPKEARLPDKVDYFVDRSPKGTPTRIAVASGTSYKVSTYKQGGFALYVEPLVKAGLCKPGRYTATQTKLRGLTAWVIDLATRKE